VAGQDLGRGQIGLEARTQCLIRAGEAHVRQLPAIGRAGLSLALAVASRRCADEIALEAGDTAADDAAPIDRKALTSELFLTIHARFLAFSPAVIVVV
jgi:hypothetical protein